MPKIEVSLGARAYTIDIDRDSLVDAARWARMPVGHNVMIVSDANVAPHYLEPLCGALGRRDVATHIIAPGESSKRLDEVARLIDALLAHGARRDTTLIALGGGVVGDLTGFAAACFMRGVAFVQVPTSLLAQVDSSVGGKTGVNHPRGKNLIGAFHQPAAVLIDTSTLNTLPDRELSAGLAEVIKSALLADSGFFAWLEQNMAALRARDAAALAHAIARCCEIKAGVVARDEQEAGERMLLNLGHTFGHAIEKVTGYASWLHGEAVGAGLVMAADLSMRRGHLGAPDVARVRAAVEAAGLPVAAQGLPPEALLEAMQHDKKFVHGQTRFIVLDALGRARVATDVTPESVDATLRAHCT